MYRLRDIRRIGGTASLFWRRAQLRTPGPIQQAIVPRLHNLKEILRLVAHAQMPVIELTGQSGDYPLTVTFVNMRFFGRFLQAQLFDDQPVTRQLDAIPFWRYRRLLNLSSGDLVICEGSRHLVARLARFGGITLSPGVRHVLDITGSWEDVRSRFHKSIRTREKQWMKRYRYEFEVSHDEKDFKEFFYDMYLPLMGTRHGELSAPATYSQGRELFKSGALHKVLRDGRWVAGSVCHVQGSQLIGDLNGVKDGDQQLIDEGSVYMSIIGPIRWAIEQGYESVDFQASGPFANSGLFQHKRSWGGAISLPPDLFRRLWINVNRLTPAAERFLVEHPTVILDSRECLQGMIFVDDPSSVSPDEIAAFQRRYATPGMTKMVIRSTACFDGHPQADIVLPVMNDHVNDG